MPSDRQTVHLRRAAARAARSHAPLVAGLLASWRRAFPADDPTDALGLTEDRLAELALCRRPRPTRWVPDAEEIAAALALDANRLIAFLRTAEAVETLSTSGERDLEKVPRLLAARDDDEGDE